MFKFLILIFLINNITSKKLMPSVDSSAHDEVNLKIKIDNTKTSQSPIKPDLRDLDPIDYNKKEKPKKNQEIKILEPSVNLLEKTIEINKNDSLETTQIKREIEPRIENLENMINISTRNNTLKKDTNIKNDQVYGEAFHDLIIGFHGSILNQTDFNSTKPADLDDYARWIELEKNLSKLTRFKKLHEEISDFESRLGRDRYDNDDTDDRIVIEADSKNEKKKLSKKLELTIQQIEHSERKKKRSDL